MLAVLKNEQQRIASSDYPNQSNNKIAIELRHQRSFLQDRVTIHLKAFSQRFDRHNTPYIEKSIFIAKLHFDQLLTNFTKKRRNCWRKGI
jgi:hypothetical protein